MQELNVIGLDVAKNVFQVHVADSRGKKLSTRRMKRGEVLEYFAKQAKARVGIEACAGAHYWGRELEKLGQVVKLMAPQYVKAYVQGDKSDARDARAISEAAWRESVPAVALRSEHSQQLQGLHRVRELWMKQRVATANQLRGLLGEFGVVIQKGYRKLREQVNQWLGRRASEELAMLRALVVSLMEHLSLLEQRIGQLEQQIKQAHRDNAASRLIQSIPGVGLLSATAVVASFGRGEHFGSARQFASALGLSPREHSSGQRQVRLGISKRGNGYVRKLLVHGARAVLKARLNKPAYEQDWVVRVAKRRGHNIAVVALANKNARRIWAMLQSGEIFNTEHSAAAA